MQNWTTAIFFTPTVYRAIRPNDVASLLGFVSNASAQEQAVCITKKNYVQEPEYVEIPTLDTKQLDWPMHGNINLTNGVSLLKWTWRKFPRLLNIGRY